MERVTLSHKPSAQIACQILKNLNSVSPKNDGDAGILVVFVNGLMLPMTAWEDTVNLLRQDPQIKDLPPISTLLYDRYGQGQTTDRDPTDSLADPTHGHDILSSVTDLHHLLSLIKAQHYPSSAPKLVLVAHSIGVPLARLYSTTYPQTVSALLFLASNLANSDFVSLFPDPASPTFTPSSLPPGTTVADLTATRARIAQMFHPAVGSAEGLSRRNLPSLLPHADLPRLLGPDAKCPWITVVNHGLDAFAEEGLRVSGTPKALNEVYVNPTWWKYNEGLCELTEPGRARGPIEAVGAGHFVQRDRPDLVAEEIVMLLERLGEE